jgi:tRNA-dihydrouridine synthase
MRDVQIYLAHFLGYLVMAIWALAVYESFPFLAPMIGLTDPDTRLFAGAWAGWFLFCYYVGYMVIVQKFTQYIVKIDELREKEERDRD